MIQYWHLVLHIYAVHQGFLFMDCNVAKLGQTVLSLHGMSFLYAKCEALTWARWKLPHLQTGAGGALAALTHCWVHYRYRMHAKWVPGKSLLSSNGQVMFWRTLLSFLWTQHSLGNSTYELTYEHPQLLCDVLLLLNTQDSVLVVLPEIYCWATIFVMQLCYCYPGEPVLDGRDMPPNPHPNRPARASMMAPHQPRDRGLHKTWNGCNNQPTSLRGGDGPLCALSIWLQAS